MLIRSFSKAGSSGVAGLALLCALSTASALGACPPGQVEAQPGGTCLIDPTVIPKFMDDLVIPPVMPRAGTVLVGSTPIDLYEIEVTQFTQQILPGPFSQTTVWSYAAVGHPETRNYPAFTIETRTDSPIRIKWVNNLKDASGKFLPHLLPLDQTLHWANPPQTCADGSHRTDCEGNIDAPYTGPVPIVTHVHGAHVNPDSDGYPEAWFLPAASNIPAGFAMRGSHFGQIPGASDEPGAALFQYRNDQRATTLWYHDHTLGMTRANVYAGPAGFYLIRDAIDDGLSLPGPAPTAGQDPNGDPVVRASVHEIPIVIQGRSFKADGSLFYPSNRDYFEGLAFGTLAKVIGIKLLPDPSSDVAPIWNPEFFGNTIVVNGKTWPKLNVEQRKYRFRFLNGNDTRFLILKLSPTTRRWVEWVDWASPDCRDWKLLSHRIKHFCLPPVTPRRLNFIQIGSDQGLLPKPVALNQLLMGPAERADVVVDFSSFHVGDEIILTNVGPDEPFNGGPFTPADPATTGQVMKFKVVARTGADTSRVPSVLTTAPSLGPANRVRQVSVNELDSATQVACFDDKTGALVVARPPCPKGTSQSAYGPTMSLLGTVDAFGKGMPLRWAEDITENPALNTTEIWEILDTTADAHPIHVHLVHFQVLSREIVTPDSPNFKGNNIGAIRGPEPWETGFKDTVIVYPGEKTRIQAKFDIPGLYVWHCHILEHEDNEMMRPYCVITTPGQQTCPDGTGNPGVPIAGGV